MALKPLLSWQPRLLQCCLGHVGAPGPPAPQAPGGPSARWPQPPLAKQDGLGSSGDHDLLPKSGNEDKSGQN